MAPVYTTLEKGNLTSNKGTVIENDNLVRVFIGDLPLNETVTILFRVKVAMNTPENATIFNQGVINGNGGIQVVTDDPLTPDPEDMTLITLIGEPPYIEAYKLVSDMNGGAVYPGDVLEYPGIVINAGPTPITGVIFEYHPENQPNGYITLIPGTVSNDRGNDDNGYPMPEYGVVSKAVTLTIAGEPVNDGDADVNSNISVDFGFYQETCPACPCLMTLGNMVWNDANNDGVYQIGKENGINGVKLNLYRDSDNSGGYTPGTDEFVGSALTFTSDAN